MAKGQRGVGMAKSATIAAVPLACQDEDAAVEFFERRLWNGTPGCAHCGSVAVAKILSKSGSHGPRYLWRCRDCKRQFTVRIGTVLEDSRIPLKHWAYAFWAACASKKGVSAMQIQRQTGLSYKSALFLMHRIRFAMTEDGAPKLAGTVEVDETFVGGKRRNGDRLSGKPQAPKAPVMALVQRGGKVMAFPIARVDSGTLQLNILSRVELSARIVTDDNPSYPGIAHRFAGGHETVNHSRREYVRGDVTTNTVEGFFSLLKRGIIGTFHSVSTKHLHRYVGEFEFRYNTRHGDDGARLEKAILAAQGKRLTYKAVVNG